MQCIISMSYCTRKWVCPNYVRHIPHRVLFAFQIMNPLDHYPIACNQFIWSVARPIVLNDRHELEKVLNPRMAASQLRTLHSMIRIVFTIRIWNIGPFAELSNRVPTSIRFIDHPNAWNTIHHFIELLERVNDRIPITYGIFQEL